VRRSHLMPFGARLDTSGNATFRLWAPGASNVGLNTSILPSARIALQRNSDGWWETQINERCTPGLRYSFRIDDELDVPDPASRYNPQGVHSASELIAPDAFEWRDESWTGRRWDQASLYELHIGTFTPEGTFQAAVRRLDDLAQLGITTLEVMPVATFRGNRGWGYDGVLPFAPHPAYGRPEDFKEFIQAAHERGLCVILDVVYNHFGPEGNYLYRYAPQFFTDRHRTPWGDAIDFAQREVREFFIHNALYWLEEYHLDGLRLDAVHAICGESGKSFIEELIARVDAGPGRERHVHLVLENEHNTARWLTSNPAQAEHGTAVSQWNDDSHHALHVLLTGEHEAYYADYADSPLRKLGRVLSEGFAYQGERTRTTQHPKGEPSARLPPSAFINFLQNHDQIGNRAFGERLTQLVPSDQLRGAMAVLLLSPQTPMLFMGEEFGAKTPFLYFCDYDGDLAQAIREGRRAEFKNFSAFANQSTDRIPDPNALSTFERSRLDWSQREQPKHADWVRYVTELLSRRRDSIEPLLPDIKPASSTYSIEGSLLTVHWPLQRGGALAMVLNVGTDPVRVEMPNHAQTIFASQSGDVLGTWQVHVFTIRS
jgi:maltooligosyltrehalose trehalohydrolase